MSPRSAGVVPRPSVRRRWNVRPPSATRSCVARAATTTCGMKWRRSWTRVCGRALPGGRRRRRRRDGDANSAVARTESRALRGGAVAGCRRDGRGVPRARRRPGSRCRAQDPPCTVRPGSRPARAVQAGSAGAGLAQSSEHRRDSRLRRIERAAGARAGARRRTDTGRSHCPAALFRSSRRCPSHDRWPKAWKRPTN